MRKVLVPLFALLSSASMSWALTANPMSNSLYDSANTASYFVARDASGNFAAGTITATAFTGTASAVADDSITTAKIADAAVTTPKFSWGAAITTARVLCVMTSGKVGGCTTSMAVNGSCGCSY